MTLNWHMLQVDNPKMFRGEKIVRIILTYVLVYTLIVGEHFLIVGLVYVVLVTISYAFAKKETRLHWERLIQNDLERLGQFFRFVSLFADVPHMKGKLKNGATWQNSCVILHRFHRPKRRFIYIV